MYQIFVCQVSVEKFKSCELLFPNNSMFFLLPSLCAMQMSELNKILKAFIDATQLLSHFGYFPGKYPGLYL